MTGNIDGHGSRSFYMVHMVVPCVALLGTVLMAALPHRQVQTFKPAMYQANSRTSGIQEAIDAAAKAGGGKVEIPAGTFVLHTAPGHPPILLKSRVTLAGAGQEKTILKLEANPKVQPAVMTNEHYTDPDATEADHDVTLEGFTIDVAAAEQVLRETQLARAIPVAGEQELALASDEGIGLDSIIRVDPGPSEEIVPVFKSSTGFKAFFMRPHAAGAKVAQLVDRLHGVALVGARNVTIQNVTIQNAPMDGVYLTSTVTPTQHRTFCQKINIQKCKFLADHRNGISVIDADGVTIANNEFQDITGDPGAPVDVEPDYPEQRGSRIAIRDNFVFRCYRGIMVTLQNAKHPSENFREESITGNKIVGTLYGYGIYVALQYTGAEVSGNTIEGPAGEGIYLLGSSHMQVRNNVITDPGRCHTVGNCRREAAGTGIRVEGPDYVTGNVISGNSIKDTQQSPTLLYGIEFSSTGKGNTIERNVVSRFEPTHGMVVHVAGKAESNTIAENKKE